MEPIAHGCRTFLTPPARPARATCRRLVLPRTQSGRRVVQGRQSPLNPDAHDCRSSDRAGRCCVHRLGRGRGGRREGECAGQVGRAIPATGSPLLPSPFAPSGTVPEDAPLLLALLPLLSSVTLPPLLAPLPPLLVPRPPPDAPAAALTACSLSCSTWAIAACMARPASWRCWLSSLPKARAAAQDELAGTPAPAALAAWCAERQLAATSPAS